MLLYNRLSKLAGLKSYLLLSCRLLEPYLPRSGGLLKYCSLRNGSLLYWTTLRKMTELRSLLLRNGRLGSWASLREMTGLRSCLLRYDRLGGSTGLRSCLLRNNRSGSSGTTDDLDGFASRLDCSRVFNWSCLKICKSGWLSWLSGLSSLSWPSCSGWVGSCHYWFWVIIVIRSV